LPDEIGSIGTFSALLASTVSASQTPSLDTPARGQRRNDKPAATADPYAIHH
jgi:hypothetical protein